jgi:hypothetical protein
VATKQVLLPLKINRVDRSAFRLECGPVAAVLRSHPRIIAGLSLVGLQRLQADHANLTNSFKAREVVAERPDRPGRATVRQRRKHIVRLATFQERHFQPDTIALVDRVASFANLRHVPPTRRLKDGTNILAVRKPDGQINVIVRPGDATNMKVDCPASEEPIRNPMQIERFADGRKRLKLSCRVSPDRPHPDRLRATLAVFATISDPTSGRAWARPVYPSRLKPSKPIVPSRNSWNVSRPGHSA